MKILQVNRFYYPHGGSERYFFEISDLLKKFGHTVAFFCMENKINKFTKWDKYFVSNISLHNITFGSAFKILRRMIYSIESKNKIRKILNDFKPDIVHLHVLDIFISPSIISEIRKRNIPIVQTLHGYNLLAPTRGSLFHNGKICEITKPNKYYYATFHKCIKNSYIASSAMVISQYIHRVLGFYNNVDFFIAPSLFLKKKFTEFNFLKEKIIIIPYFLDSNKYNIQYFNPINNYILFFGRLSPEKGLKYLIQAMKLLPKVKLKIVGQGSQEKELRTRNKELGNKNVKFIGFKDGDELKKLIANSRFTVLPSVWYEVFGLSILESFAFGKPVIASNIGGIPEVVKDRFNGLLIKPGSVAELVEKINKLWNNAALTRELGKNARKYVEKTFGSEEHYKKLMDIYNRAIEKHK